MTEEEEESGIAYQCLRSGETESVLLCCIS
jgi:hypothetical protein